MTFGQVVAILEAHGILFHREGKGSHSIYRGVVGGEVRLVTVAAHRPGQDVKPGTLAAIIRQSGLGKTAFR